MVFRRWRAFNSLTVGENVSYALRERGKLDEVQINRAVETLLDKVGISAERDRFPADLSTGMKRSVAIARALAENPERYFAGRNHHDGRSADGAPVRQADGTPQN